MQLRHIRPGSLEWQDAKADDVDQGSERLSPEEIGRLRKLSDDRSGLPKDDKHPRTGVQ